MWIVNCELSHLAILFDFIYIKKFYLNQVNKNKRGLLFEPNRIRTWERDSQKVLRTVSQSVRSQEAQSYLFPRQKMEHQNDILTTFLVVLWLRICLAVQGMRVWYLVWELRSRMSLGNSAYMPQLQNLLFSCWVMYHFFATPWTVALQAIFLTQGWNPHLLLSK